MAKYKFLSESPTEDDKVHQYVLEVTVKIDKDDVRTYQQDVVFNPDEREEKAQEYADQMEADLKAQKEQETTEE